MLTEAAGWEAAWLTVCPTYFVGLGHARSTAERTLVSTIVLGPQEDNIGLSLRSCELYISGLLIVALPPFMSLFGTLAPLAGNLLSSCSSPIDLHSPEPRAESHQD